MINKLSSLIMINFENLNLNRIFNNETKPILVYFLKNDIDKLIGKDEYEVNLHDIFSNGLRFRPYNDNMLLVSCDEKEYLLGTELNKFILYDKKFANNRLEISYDRINKVYINDMYIENEEEAIHEIQKIFLKEEVEYEYSKTIVTKDGIIKYPNYSLLEDNKSNDLKLLSNVKGVQKRLIDIIETPKINDDMLVYFENIFSILESKTLNEKKLSLRLN